MDEEDQALIDQLKQELKEKAQEEEPLEEAQEQDVEESAALDSNFDFDKGPDDASDPIMTLLGIIRFDSVCPLF